MIRDDPFYPLKKERAGLRFGVAGRTMNGRERRFISPGQFRFDVEIGLVGPVRRDDELDCAEGVPLGRDRVERA